MTPSNMTVSQKKKLVVSSTNYHLIEINLYKLGINGILQRCVVEHEIPMILVEAHEVIVGGHYEGKETT
jgi:hypothetical protein